MTEENKEFLELIQKHIDNCDFCEEDNPCSCLKDTYKAFKLGKFSNPPSKDDIFIKHIASHREIQDSEPKGRVICKICGKTVEEIYKEAQGLGKPKLSYAESLEKNICPQCQSNLDNGRCPKCGVKVKCEPIQPYKTYKGSESK